MAIRPDGSGDVTDTHVAWTLKKGAPHTPSLLLVGDELYMVSDKGVATCVDARTGKRALARANRRQLFLVARLRRRQDLYSERRRPRRCHPNPARRFTKLADTGFKERTLASYAVGDKALFIRTEKNLYRVEQK